MTFEAWLTQEPWLQFAYRLGERRFKETYGEIPNGPGRALEIGAPSALTAPMVADKGYVVEGVTLGPPGTRSRRQMTHADGRAVTFTVESHRTVPFRDDAGSDSQDYAWTRQIAAETARGDRVPTPELRQDDILIRGRKQCETVARPAWLYG